VTYWALLRFFLPLVLTQIALNTGSQFLNGGIARLPQATHTLAVFGLAWGITDFLLSPLAQVRQLGLVLAGDYPSLMRLQQFILFCSGGLMCALIALAGSQLGDWILVDLHGVERKMAQKVQIALWSFVPLPIFTGLSRLYSGLLIQSRRTDLVSLAMGLGMAFQIGAVAVLLQVEWIGQNPIVLPIIAVYLSEIVALVVVLIGYRRYVSAGLPREASAFLRWGYIVGFFWPLALVMSIQGFSRPLVNLFVSRQHDGVSALAVLAVVYVLAHLPYGWLNELRSIPAAFSNEGSERKIRVFSLGCGLCSFSSMALLFWTPMRDYILLNWVGINSGLAEQCALPLIIFSFFPLAVCLRSYLNGVAVVQHRTKALAPSAPARVGAIFIALLVFSTAGWSGATMGIAALLCGFVVESLAVWIGVREWPKIEKEWAVRREKNG
tara:strand:+ start:400 stop:1713 length:1314 start_codon:yes stop_codon:yes gene_type:complete